jgi:hypothetical protein
MQITVPCIVANAVRAIDRLGSEGVGGLVEQQHIGSCRSTYTVPHGTFVSRKLRYGLISGGHRNASMRVRDDYRYSMHLRHPACPEFGLSGKKDDSSVLGFVIIRAIRISS